MGLQGTLGREFSFTSDCSLCSPDVFLHIPKVTQRHVFCLGRGAEADSTDKVRTQLAVSLVIISFGTI